jgi:autotransporter-associated beta strand protein
VSLSNESLKMMQVNKIINSKSAGDLKRHGVLMILCLLLSNSQDANSEIVFSGQRNIPIPTSFDGTYIDISREVFGSPSIQGWDLNPIFGGLYIFNSPSFQPLRSGNGNEDPIIRLASTTVIGSDNLGFSSGWGSSGPEVGLGHLGSGSPQFADGESGYLGFKLVSSQADTVYGWMQVVLTENGDGVIQSWAYDDSGVAIRAGANGLSAQRVVTGVQETPTSAAAAGDSILLASGGKVTFDDGATGGSFSGIIEGAGEIQIAGTGGLRLSGTNAFTGTATVQENSKLIVADSRNLGSASVALGNSSALVFESLATNNGGTNIFSNTISLNGGGGVLENNGTGTVEVTGAVTGSGALTKDGSGDLTLSGSNTYTGNTVINTGKLVVNGSIAASALTVVRDGASIGGSGSVGAMTLSSGGQLAPGNSPGLLTSGDLTLDPGSIFSWEIDPTATQTRGTGYDAMNVTGTLSGSGAIFRIVVDDYSDSFWGVDHSWTDIFTDGSEAISWTGFFEGGFQYYDSNGNPVASPSPSTGTFSFSGPSTFRYSAVAVPEPTSALIGLLIASGLLHRRRN